jgi:hypothetical protein
MNDPRQADVDEAARLFDAAERDGAAPLPELMAVDLCVLGAALQSVFDQQVWRTWLGLDEATRDEFVVNVLNGLARRRLLDQPADLADSTPVLRARAPLALIMAARSQPAFVGICSAGDLERGAPRMYGIAEEGRGLRAVLVEQASADRAGFGAAGAEQLAPAEDRARAGDLDQVYRYALVSPKQAIRMLVSWLRADTGSRAPAFGPGAGVPRVFDVYRHDNGEQLSRRQVVAAESQPDNALEASLTELLSLGSAA